MFFEPYSAKIQSFSPQAKELKDGGMDEYCKLSLSFEFTEKFAKGLGLEVDNDLQGFTGQLHSALSRKRLLSCSLPVPAKDVTAHFCDIDDSEETIDIRPIEMCAVTAKRPNSEDPSPVVIVTLEFPLSDDRMLWFGNRLKSVVEVVLDKVQQKLPGVE